MWCSREEFNSMVPDCMLWQTLWFFFAEDFTMALVLCCTLGLGVEDVVGLWKVTCRCDTTSLGMFLVCGVKTNFLAFGARRMIGSWVWSIQPLFPLMLGCTAVNQEYPRITLWYPRSVRKNWREWFDVLFWHSGLCSTWALHFCFLCCQHWTAF